VKMKEEIFPTEDELRELFGPSREETKQEALKELESFDPSGVTLTNIEEFIRQANGYGTKSGYLAIGKLSKCDKSLVYETLTRTLKSDDLEMRCRAATALCLLDRENCILLIPLLQDLEDGVRWHICGLLHDFGNDKTIIPLTHIAKTDKAVGVRVQATSALGRIGGKNIMPTLEWIRDNDHEFDIHRWSPSSRKSD
jgi:hypothetical protein